MESWTPLVDWCTCRTIMGTSRTWSGPRGSRPPQSAITEELMWIKTLAHEGTTSAPQMRKSTAAGWTLRIQWWPQSIVLFLFTSHLRISGMQPWMLHVTLLTTDLHWKWSFMSWTCVNKGYKWIHSSKLLMKERLTGQESLCHTTQIKQDKTCLVWENLLYEVGEWTCQGWSSLDEENRLHEGSLTCDWTPQTPRTWLMEGLVVGRWVSFSSSSSNRWFHNRLMQNLYISDLCFWFWRNHSVGVLFYQVFSPKFVRREETTNSSVTCSEQCDSALPDFTQWTSLFVQNHLITVKHQEL